MEPVRQGSLSRSIKYVILVTALVSLLSAAISLFGLFSIREIHVLINSRMDQMLALTAKASRAEGVAEGEENSEQ